MDSAQHMVEKGIIRSNFNLLTHPVKGFFNIFLIHMDGNNELEGIKVVGL